MSERPDDMTERKHEITARGRMAAYWLTGLGLALSLTALGLLQFQV